MSLRAGASTLPQMVVLVSGASIGVGHLLNKQYGVKFGRGLPCAEKNVVCFIKNSSPRSM